MLLTEENIGSAFPENRKFKYTVEAAFKSDADLGSYDAEYKEYKIKEIYMQSIK